MFNVYLGIQKIKNIEIDPLIKINYLNRKDFTIHDHILKTQKNEESDFNKNLIKMLTFFDNLCNEEREQCLKDMKIATIASEFKLTAQYQGQPKMILFLITLRIIIIYNRALLVKKLYQTNQKIRNTNLNNF